MALLAHLKKKSKLPDGRGTLSKDMPSSSIQAANESVAHLDQDHVAGERGKYKKVSQENKVKIAKYASSNGIAATVRKFPEFGLKELTVHGWKQLYCS